MTTSYQPFSSQSRCLSVIVLEASFYCCTHTGEWMYSGALHWSTPSAIYNSLKHNSGPKFYLPPSLSLSLRHTLWHTPFNASSNDGREPRILQRCRGCFFIINCHQTEWLRVAAMTDICRQTRQIPGIKRRRGKQTQGPRLASATRATCRGLAQNKRANNRVMTGHLCISILSEAPPPGEY